MRKPKKPPRPKLRKWFPARGPTWLRLEPAGLAMVGGVFFTTCSMVVYLIRHLAGASMALPDVLAGIALTFFVSYTGTGFFVWYMLHLAERELGQPQAKPRPEHPHAPPRAEDPTPVAAAPPEAPPDGHTKTDTTEDQS